MKTAIRLYMSSPEGERLYSINQSICGMNFLSTNGQLLTMTAWLMGKDALQSYVGGV
jgi:hypothetical protein